MSRTETSNYSRSISLPMSYEHTLDELNNLQKQFHRMHLIRRQKINAIKLKRTHQLRAENKIKTKDQHIRNVKQRRTSLDIIKTQEKISKANKKQRKRQARLRLIETVGSNVLKYGTSFIHQQKIITQRREIVLQRKQQLQMRKDQKRKQEFLQKQRKREQKIDRALNQKKSFTHKSASTSFLISDQKNKENKENMNDSFTLLDDNDSDDSLESDHALICDEKVKQNQKQIMRSLSTNNLRSTQKDKEKRPALCNVNNSNTKKRRVYGFMKPTLSAYLLTNNPTNLFAFC